MSINNPINKSAIDNFPDLFRWLNEILGDDIEKFVFIDHYQKDDIKISLFTNNYRYYISVYFDEYLNSLYMKCDLESLEPEPGEDWLRGRDLSDGDYNIDTWGKIKDDIISHELVKLKDVNK